jgi:hypothetical protein
MARPMHHDLKPSALIFSTEWDCGNELEEQLLSAHEEAPPTGQT